MIFSALLRSFGADRLLSACLACGLVGMGQLGWSAQVETNLPPAVEKGLGFGIFWPPQDPSNATAQAKRPLLKGRLTTRLDRPVSSDWLVHLRVVLSRPSDEEGREFWNSQLAFPEFDWMRYVRVWDGEKRWLWPNLPYLLRLFGRERVDRYGGVDPVKGVDNDFAAVLIRMYDPSGRSESESTKAAPLVAAEWYPVDATAADRQTVVHTAQSDEFTLQIGSPDQHSKGLAIVWVIYADFMGARAPESWSQSPEFAGGVLACFEVGWDLGQQRGRELSIEQAVPKRGTSFAWEPWSVEARAAHDPKVFERLSNLSTGSKAR